MNERARRSLRIGAVVVLGGGRIAIGGSFLSGLGDGVPDERVTGDAQRGGQRLDELGPRVRVEVLNAGGVSGLARQATEHLRDRGFDVVYMGNAGTFDQQVTVVLARTPNIGPAQRVAQALGTDSVVVEPDPELYVDATVQLGSDWPRAAPASSDSLGVWGRLKRSVERL